jgi:hypothetical protein
MFPRKKLTMPYRFFPFAHANGPEAANNPANIPKEIAANSEIKSHF